MLKIFFSVENYSYIYFIIKNYDHDNSLQSFRKSGQVIGHTSKGLLGYDKDDKTFSCDSSDLDCAGMPNIPFEFEVKVQETQNTKTFKHSFTKKDGEGEVMYYMYKAVDNSGINFMIFND